eukprot:Seg9743.1 transcript_id=Seg9743.1/GoldUCD/mRNA.D3Y31 product="hypothetical protein" protein_id=Seg9743.1/GoldUCD/D3Y31
MIANNAFFLVVKFMNEKMPSLKMNATIEFTVTEVIKSPLKDVKKGYAFAIIAEKAKCPCLTSLDPGYYAVTGSVNDKSQLVISNVLMKFEK